MLDPKSNPLHEAIDWLHLAFEKTGDTMAPKGAIDSLFKEEKAFFEDQNRFKAALCSRRAGKTWTGAVGLLEAAQKNPETLNPYIALTRESAKRIIWSTLQDINEKYNYGAEFNDSALIATLPNGSQIFCVGADQSNFIQRLRGTKYKRVVVDEAQGFRAAILNELLDAVLTPSLADLDGDLWVLGTPGPLAAGPFFEMTTRSRGYALHRWTIFNNPFIPEARAFLDEFLNRKGWDEDHPTIQREWFGRWFADPDALVYKFRDDRNLYDTLPPHTDWFYVLGIDYGWIDHTAFAVCAFSPDDSRVFVVESQSFPKLTPSEIGTKTKTLLKKYPHASVVCDTGGLGKSITEELRLRFSIPCKAAEKREKLPNIDLMNGDFIGKKLFIHQGNQDLIHQYESLTRADNGLEDPNLPNDLCFAPQTKIKTFRGDKPIESIDVGERVLTRKGFKRVTKTYAHESDHLLELNFDNGVKILCTKNHPFHVKTNFVRADALTYGDQVTRLPLWWRLKPWMGWFLGAIRKVKEDTFGTISPAPDMEKPLTFIATFGKNTMDPFQKATIFIIKTIEPLITVKRTSFAYPLSNIDNNTLSHAFKSKGKKNSWMLFEPKRPYGTNPKRDASGINFMPGACILVNAKRLNPPTVKPVENDSPKKSKNILNSKDAPMPVTPNTDAIKRSTISSRIASIAKRALQSLDMLKRACFAAALVQRHTITEKTMVYNLEVEDIHEYYAEGFLVKNCDAALYAYREAKHYAYTPPEPILSKDSTEWMDQQEQMEADRLERIRLGQEDEEDVWSEYENNDTGFPELE